MKRFFAALLAALLLLSLSALAEGATLTAKGSGTVFVPSDTAVISFGVARSTTDIAEAQAGVNQTLSAVIDKLLSMGVAETDIRTNEIDIHEDYDYYSVSSVTPDSEKPYVVENTLTVTLTELDRAGEFIDAVVEAGANRFSGIRFTASDTADACDRALALAVENARARAQVLAAASGMALGEMVSVTDEAAYYGLDSGIVEKAADGAATRVYPTDQEVSAQVTIVYALVPVEG